MTMNEHEVLASRRLLPDGVRVEIFAPKDMALDDAKSFVAYIDTAIAGWTGKHNQDCVLVCSGCAIDNQQADN